MWLFVSSQIHHILVINNSEFDVAKPALTPQYVSRKVGVLGKVDNALESETGGFESDFVSEAVNGTTQRIQPFGDTSFNIQSQRCANLSTEQANRAAGINHGFCGRSQPGSAQNHVQQ